MEDDELGACGLRDPRRMVEHADGHVELLASLGVPHEARNRRVDGQHDPRLARELAEPLRPRIVHPEAAFEVDLAGGVAALLEELDGLFGAVLRGHAGWAEVQLGHGPTVHVRCQAPDVAAGDLGTSWGNFPVPPDPSSLSAARTSRCAA